MSIKKKVIVRLAKKEDSETLLGFFHQAAIEVNEMLTCLPNGSKGIYPSPEMILDILENHKVYIALDDTLKEGWRTEDGCIIGGMLSNHSYNPGFLQVDWQRKLKDEEVAYWHCLRVLYASHGRGAARQIMSTAIQYEKEAGMNAIRFDTVTGNDNAIHLYDSLGFERRGIYPVYEEDIGWHDNLMFEMSLDQG